MSNFLIHSTMVCQCGFTTRDINEAQQHICQETDSVKHVSTEGRESRPDIHNRTEFGKNYGDDIHTPKPSYVANCKLCDDPTDTIYNLEFKAVHICPSCVRKIVKQEICSW